MAKTSSKPAPRSKGSALGFERADAHERNPIKWCGQRGIAYGILDQPSRGEKLLSGELRVPDAVQLVEARA